MPTRLGILLFGEYNLCQRNFEQVIIEATEELIEYAYLFVANTSISPKNSIDLATRVN